MHDLFISRELFIVQRLSFSGNPFTFYTSIKFAELVDTWKIKFRSYLVISVSFFGKYADFLSEILTSGPLHLQP